MGANIKVEQAPYNHIFPVKNDHIGNPLDIDGVGSIFSHLFGPSLAHPIDSWVQKGRLQNLKQPHHHQLRDNGYLYVPYSCNHKACPLHVSLHACKDQEEDVLEWVMYKGYLNYAAVNDLVVMFPTAKKCWRIKDN